MRWSPFLHVMSVLAGLLSIAAMVTGIIIGEKALGTITGNNLQEYATYSIYLALWFALATLIHLVIEDQEE